MFSRARQRSGAHQGDRPDRRRCRGVLVMMRSRELVFAGLAAVLLVLYLGLGMRVGPAFIPPSSPTPTPTKPVTLVTLPPGASVNVSGTIAFALRGDVYLLSGKGYVPLTSDGRSHQPSISTDG